MKSCSRRSSTTYVFAYTVWYLFWSVNFSWMYGGSGIVPSVSSISYNIPLYSNLTWVIPSFSFSVTTAFNFPSPKETMSPTCNLFWGRDKTSHSSSIIFFKSKSSITAPVFSFTPISLAGITLVSFKTKTSPGFK